MEQKQNITTFFFSYVHLYYCYIYRFFPFLVLTLRTTKRQPSHFESLVSTGAAQVFHSLVFSKPGSLLLALGNEWDSFISHWRKKKRKKREREGKKNLYEGVYLSAKLHSVNGGFSLLPKQIHFRCLKVTQMRETTHPPTATTTGQTGHQRTQMSIFSQLNCALTSYFKSSLGNKFL